MCDLGLIDDPNQLRMVSIQCNNQDAAIEWTLSGDNRAPILPYTIQFNASFTPDSWEVSFENVLATETHFKVEMIPWCNYAFRVIARNKIGPSLALDHSSLFTIRLSNYRTRIPTYNVVGRGTLFRFFSFYGDEGNLLVFSHSSTDWNFFK